MKTYHKNENFRQELQAYHELNQKEPQKIDMVDILIKYGVSYSCAGAVSRFMANPNLEDEQYLKAMLLPPISISSELSTTIEEMDQNYSNLSAEEILRSDNPQGLPNYLHYVTTIQVLPYVRKSELHELINEYWSELEARINQRTKHGDKIIGNELLGNVRRPKNQEETDRENLIIKLTEDGEEDLYIQTRLSKAGFGRVTLENIRQIRMRHKRNLDK